MANKIRFQDFSDYYEALFDNLLDGLAYCQMIFDSQGRPIDWVYLEVNKNFEKLTGLKKIVGEKATVAIPGVAVSNPELFEIYGRVSLTGKSERFETYVKLLRRWFLISVYSPKKNFFVAVFRNITDQKQTERELENARIAAQNVLEDLRVEKEKLADANAKDEAMLASITDGLVASDKEGRIFLVNKGFENMLGFKSAEVVGKKFTEIIPLLCENSELIEEVERPANKALLGITTTTTTTFQYRKKNGSLFPVAITVSPIISRDEIMGFIEIFSDITKEKEIEQLRSDFLALASHQLRTPLSGTKWLIETMQRGVIGELTPKQEAYLSQIYIINERMIGLVFGMLNVLRLESAVIEMKKITFTLNDIIKDLLLSSGIAAKSKHITIDTTNGSRTFIMKTDLEVLKSILECFISNAINYSHTGQKIIFDIKEEPKEVVFLVKDQGLGIPKEEQKRIFERFYRATNAKNAKPDGTGLGLNIAKALALKIGAEISFESEEGKGSTFYLHILKTKVEDNTLIKDPNNYE